MATVSVMKQSSSGVRCINMLHWCMIPAAITMRYVHTYMHNYVQNMHSAGISANQKPFGQLWSQACLFLLQLHIEVTGLCQTEAELRAAVRTPNMNTAFSGSGQKCVARGATVVSVLERAQRW